MLKLTVEFIILKMISSVRIYYMISTVNKR